MRIWANGWLAAVTADVTGICSGGWLEFTRSESNGLFSLGTILASKAARGWRAKISAILLLNVQGRRWSYPAKGVISSQCEFVFTHSHTLKLLKIFVQTKWMVFTPQVPGPWSLMNVSKYALSVPVQTTPSANWHINCLLTRNCKCNQRYIIILPNSK